MQRPEHDDQQHGQEHWQQKVGHDLEKQPENQQ
jgi:hypothetical protein